MFIFIYSIYYNFKTNWLKSDPHIHLNRNLYKVYVARTDLLIWFHILMVRNTLKFKRIAGSVIIISIINNNKWNRCQREYVYKDESLKCILNPIEIIISIVVVISIVVATMHIYVGTCFNWQWNKVGSDWLII